jgi:polyhydroxyalkanoate synthesis repressor PhaR
MTHFDRPVRIEKYPNRRLLNIGTGTFVTLDELAAMKKRGKNFLVHDAKTGVDITRAVLPQVAFVEENFRSVR